MFAPTPGIKTIVATAVIVFAAPAVTMTGVQRLGAGSNGIGSGRTPTTPGRQTRRGGK